MRRYSRGGPTRLDRRRRRRRSAGGGRACGRDEEAACVGAREALSTREAPPCIGVPRRACPGGAARETTAYLGGASWAIRGSDVQLGAGERTPHRVCRQGVSPSVGDVRHQRDPWARTAGHRCTCVLAPCAARRRAARRVARSAHGDHVHRAPRRTLEDRSRHRERPAAHTLRPRGFARTSAVSAPLYSTRGPARRCGARPRAESLPRSLRLACGACRHAGEPAHGYPVQHDGPCEGHLSPGGRPRAAAREDASRRSGRDRE